MKKELFNLLKSQAFAKKKVVLASGKISNYYIDVRKVSISPAGIYYISHLVYRLLGSENIDALGGPTLGADPIVSTVAFLAHKNKRKIKAFLIRKTPKKHGRQKLIEGQALNPGEKVILIDDVATSGGSFIKSIEVLKRAKVTVVKAISVVDRQEGAEENLAKYNCPLVSLFTKNDFLKSCE
jgi:orotate phosphoribosyltransferase